jgi:hypothetical protein
MLLLETNIQAINYYNVIGFVSIIIIIIIKMRDTTSFFQLLSTFRLSIGIGR